MDHENEQELAEFEQRLRMAMQRREAPMGLKARVLAESRARRQHRFAEGGGWMLQRIAASAVLAAIASGIVVYHQMEVRSVERQKGEEAKAQVMLALRITNRALDRINDRINDKSSSSEENR
ncbi:hypothetical protein ACFPT7_10950 [Acidicapsa dinghuensis]|uniref:DUF3619 family protein n=1 Tax=Acidicapsa dinghuensis TaxID=2218256 RepID=A0ABW1EHV5_9BACT|nr:hypothetical protein [Acidicapsa dinghuensis]